MSVGGLTVGSFPVSGNGDSSTIRTFSIQVGSDDVTERYHLESGIQFQSEINARGILDFRIVDTAPPSTEAQVGQAVRFIADGSTVFVGTIDEIQTEEIGESKTTFRTFRCVDYNQLADRKIVNDVFVSTNAGSIVQELITEHLAEDGVTAGQIDNGTSIDRVVFQYRTLATVLDELSELSGNSICWYIDSGKRLNFENRGAVVAPWDITASSNPTRGLVKRTSRQDLRNRQIVRAGRDRTAQQVETFVGDGETRAFNLRFDVAEKPSKIETDTGAGFVEIPQADIGVGGLDQENKWYFNKGRSTIAQDNDETVLAATHKVRVTYIGIFRVVSIRDDNDSIDERKAIEGGSGLYVDVQSDPEIESSSFAQLRADGFLERFGSVGTVIEYSTDMTGLAAGQLQNIQDPDTGISGEFLIVNVNGRDRGDLFQDLPEKGLTFQVRASSAGRQESWIEFWRRLWDAAKRLPIDEDETLDLTVNQVDVVDVTDTLVVDQTDNVDVYGNDPHSVFIVGEGVIGKSLVGDPEKS